MKGHRLVTNQRGSVLLFTTVTLFLLLIFGGIAIDLTYVGSAKGELQRSMDAGALAGAGKLGFDDTVFPAVRQEAWTFANLNPYRVGTITPDLNPANAPGGDIVLGIWENGSFTPSLDGSRVNAVRCQVTTQVPTSFLGLLGLSTLQVGAFATAVANPPQSVPPESCVFPIALTGCPFEDAGAFSSQGCGAASTMVSSSGKLPGTTAGTNTATWANLCGTSTPSVPETKAAIEAAADPTLACNTCTSDTGTTIGTNNGMQQVVFDLLEQKFIEQYGDGDTYEVTDSGGNVTYSGPGWKLFVPVIETACPPQAISGEHKIIGWSKYVMTQVINHGECAVANPADGNSWPLCPPPMNPAGAPKDPNLRAAFGVYSCTLVDSIGSREPEGPRSALGSGVRLVQ